MLWLALPIVLVRLWWRGRSDPTYRPRWRERFGFYRQPISSKSIWFHTVSAGESIAAAPLIRDFAQRDALKRPVLVTTMTPTGSEQVTGLLGDCVQHCYAPYDFTFAVRRFFAHVQPRALILMETEIWPNLILQAKALGIPVLLMNARLSAKSMRGYERFAWLGRPVLQAIDLIACQTQEHAARFQTLGVLAGTRAGGR
jgi:3-deoxy-D-manno-octulosonic-acid transferase